MRVRMAIAELCESLLLALVRILLPTQGRHRAVPDQHSDAERTLTAPQRERRLRRWHGVEVAV
ncbi:hypothetical protein E0500_007305 [Streptomyces sp. KM273126]|uniref:hypothetical protein n=1 Tax=Streptomyces sp. KM273126 TaxID=2545247 RepID=UPI00103E831A|nr:hypothetical protein [Streptomyces sp. KM273126]MBA2807251.1 hypothetical protein [Streptomyces sp. KM273126]